MLYHELLSKMRRIGEEYGPDAELWELAMQVAILEEKAGKG